MPQTASSVSDESSCGAPPALDTRMIGHAQPHIVAEVLATIAPRPVSSQIHAPSWRCAAGATAGARMCRIIANRAPARRLLCEPGGEIEQRLCVLVAARRRAAG